MTKKELELKVEQLTRELNERQSLNSVIKKIVAKEIVWIDKDLMDEAARLQWSNEARNLLENKVFKSLVGDYHHNTNGEIIKNLIEYCAKESQNWEDLMGARWKMVGITLIKEQAIDLLIHKPKVTYDEINEAV